MLKAKREFYFIFLSTLISIAYCQPDNPPLIGDAPCEPEPISAGPDTAFGFPDSEGFRSIFNGKDFSGWWQSCLTGHSASDRQRGAIIRVSPEEKAIFMINRNNAGGVLMTRKKYDHYEIIFEMWLNFDEDRGILNRTNATGQCYQTTLDYISNASVGGAWGDGGYIIRDIRPWRYVTEDDIHIPDIPESWTNVTKVNDPQSYGCAMSGCVEADYPRLWDKDGWMQMKIQFYGGVIEAPITKMKSWFRKSESQIWVPILQDTTLEIDPVIDGYIGIQVHQGGKFIGNGSWFRNIKLRELEADGTPIIPDCRDSLSANYNPQATTDFPGACDVTNVTPERKNQTNPVKFNKSLSVIIDSDETYRLQVLDVQGKVLIKTKVKGPGEHLLPTQNIKQGIVFLRVTGAQGQVFVRKYFLNNSL